MLLASDNNQRGSGGSPIKELSIERDWRSHRDRLNIILTRLTSKYPYSNLSVDSQNQEYFVLNQMLF